MDKKFIVILISILLLMPILSLNIAQSHEPSHPIQSNSTYPYPGDDWAWKMVGADLAHDLGETGEGVRIAVLDTGIDYTHPDLEDKMWDGIGYDFVNDDEDPMDNDGHGTHVAGIIASVAPDAELMALKVIEEKGGRWQEVSKALRFARENGADIISMSFGADGSPMGRAFEIQLNQAYNDGLYMTAAAGNDATDSENYPAAYDSTAAVSAVDHEKEKTGYSNYGDWLDLTAPGGDTDKKILSTIPGGEYGYKIGTSMATPFVAGTAAIMMGANPGLDGRQIRDRINEQAIDLGNPDYYGYGLVNAYLAAGVEVPSHPENVRGSSEDERTKIRWDPPRFHGLDPIERYDLYRSSNDDLEIIADLSPDTLEYVDTEVNNEVTYTYKITASNVHGESSFSTPIYLTPRESPVEPSKVREVNIVSIEPQVEIKWSEPMDDGGAPITKYNIYRNGELIGETDETVFTDLDASGQVTYTLSASNEIGEGPTSDPLQISVNDDHDGTDETTSPIIPVITEWWFFFIVGIMIIGTIIAIYVKIRKPGDILPHGRAVGLPYRQDENILSLWSSKGYDRRAKAVPRYRYSYP